MITFVLLAALLTVVSVALIAVPLLRQKPAAPPAPWAALIAAGVLALGSAIFYVASSHWSWSHSEAADSPQTMVARLARKLERNPGDLQGWLMLGRSYVALQQYPLAERAYRRANQLENGRSVEALIGEAEALALGDETELDRRAGRLIDQALALDPHSGKALFFGAALAMRRGELALARERFTQVLALDPPDNVRSMLEQQIAALDERIAANGGASAQNPRSGPAPESVGKPADQRSAANASVRINVLLAPNLSSSASGSAPLFVFVRDPARPGPPLAVKRLESRFPQSVELTASDSMVPGRTLTAGLHVQVVARIARSGNPVGAPGDPFGEIGYLVGQDGPMNIVIDRLTP